jgi:anti-sigma factor RsiW
MSDHPSIQVLAQYSKRALSPADFLEVHRHILSCPACDEKCSSPQQLKEDYSSLRAALLPQPEEAPYHLSTDEASGYVARRLGRIDLEIVESHLELCDDCAETVRLLKEEEASAVVSQASGVDTGRGVLAEAPWRVLSSVPSASRWMHGWRMAALAAVVCVLLVATLLFGLKLFKRSEVAVTPTPGANEAGKGGGGANSSSPSTAGGQQNSQGTSAGTKNAAPGENEAVQENAPASELLALNDQGRRLALDEKGNLTGGEGLPTDLQRSIERMLSTGKVPRADGAEALKGGRSILLGEDENGAPFRLLSPVGKIVLDNRPSFNWQPLSGASSYTVTIVDARLNEVMTSGPLTTTSWRPAKPLVNGSTYSWQVTAIKDGSRIVSPVLPLPPARFKILGQGRAGELEQARKAYANSHLALAALYARAGLRDEAEAELRALLRDNPRSRVVRNLLRDVRR